MKLMTGFVALFLAINVFAGEGAGGHGGGNFIDYASPFPEPEKLQLAIDLVKSKVSSSTIPEKFKEEISTEVDRLEANNKYLYIESLVVVQTDGADLLEVPEDFKAFRGYEAITGEELGSSIYFSRRALSKDLKEFSLLLLHEVLHHTVGKVMSKDEGYINALSKGIMEGNISQALRFAMENDFYVLSGFYQDQIFNYVVKEYGMQKCLERLREDQCRKFATHALIRFKLETRTSLGILFFSPIRSVLDSLAFNIGNMIWGDVWTSDKRAPLTAPSGQFLLGILNEAWKKSGQKEIGLNSLHLCKKKEFFFNKCSEKDLATFADLFQRSDM